MGVGVCREKDLSAIYLIEKKISDHFFFSITISIKFSRRKHYWKKKKNSQCSLLYYRNMEIIYMHISNNCLVIITVRNRKQNCLFGRKETWKQNKHSKWIVEAYDLVSSIFCWVITSTAKQETGACIYHTKNLVQK